MNFDPSVRVDKLRVSMMSATQILALSSGEVISSDTMNPRTLLPSNDGLFCQRIFGPIRDETCGCPTPRRRRVMEEVRCDHCGVERISANARRDRFGHIVLAAPVCHIWRYRGSGNQISLLTGIPPKKLDQLVHYTRDVVTFIDPELIEQFLELHKEMDEQSRSLIEELHLGFILHPAAAAHVQSFIPQAALRIQTGAEAVRTLLANLEIQKLLSDAHAQLEDLEPQDLPKAVEKIRLIEKVRDGGTDVTNMVLDVIPVIPPSLRPMMQMDSGQFASSDLNDLYRKVINRNNRLKRFLALTTPQIILRNEKRLLQNAVDTLLDNATSAQPALSTTDRPLRSISDQLRGKKGRFRQNLLGKRVDYSGRSVIVSGPDLNLGQCGLPYDMAAELFRPHLIQKIMAVSNIDTKSKAAKLSKDTHHPLVRLALDELAQDRVIILNRAPTLHRLSMQAFNPILSDDKVIRLHPLSCGGFNADFDGDQMAVHAPLSSEALREAKMRMRGSLNTVSPANGMPSALPSLDIILGIYKMTKLRKSENQRIRYFADETEALLALQLRAIEIDTPIEVGGIEDTTSAGRIMFNQALPPDLPFHNRDADKKLMSSIIMGMYDSDEYSPSDIAQTLDSVKNLGFRYAFLSGLSIGVSDMITPAAKPDAIAHAENAAGDIHDSYENGLIDDEERHEHIIKIWQQTSDAVKGMVEEFFPDLGDLYLMASSGAKGNIDNVRQMVGMRGLMSNPSGRTIERPVKSNFAEGLSVFEYFISTHGARKGLADTALRTADAGYLTRRLVDVAHHLYIHEEDCGTTEGISRLPSDDDFAVSLSQRILARDLEVQGQSNLKAGARITPKIAEELAARLSPQTEVFIRSPLLCKSHPGLCALCYGDSLATLEPPEMGLTAGVIAAQSIGEPGTQLTMRTFHRGGVAGADITNGLPRVEEILEARKPSLLSPICSEMGMVSAITPNEITVTGLTSGEDRVYEKRWQNANIRFTTGDLVKEGDLLTTGSADLREMLEVAGLKATWKYATREIQGVYQSQGVDLQDKHIEVILRTMFTFVQVEDPGESELLESEIIRRSELQEINQQLEENAQPQVRSLIFGITQAALLSEGFMSAASFQRATQVVTEASLTQCEDQMTGLKENVIVGQTLPILPVMNRASSRKR